MKDFPASLHTATREGKIPLHVACEHGALDIVKHLLDLDVTSSEVCDAGINFSLHYACHGGSHSVIKYLLEQNISLISERNACSMLPFHALCLSQNAKSDSECREYIESLWLILIAYPDAILNP